jgi:hypothetical protein
MLSLRGRDVLRLVVLPLAVAIAVGVALAIAWWRYQ